MRNKSTPITILLGLLALAGIFFAVDLNLSRSETTNEHRLITYHLGNDTPAPVPVGQRLTVAVAGENAFAEKLRRALLAELTDSSLSAYGEWQVTADADNNNVHLLVQIENNTTFWTPVYAQATLITTLAHASDGDLSWHGTVPVIMETDDDALILRADGEFQLRDRSGGLLSRPAYHRLLAESMATEIVQRLETSYTQTQ